MGRKYYSRKNKRITARILELFEHNLTDFHSGKKKIIQVSWTIINIILKNAFSHLLLNVTLDLLLRNVPSRAAIVTSCPKSIKTFSEMLFVFQVFQICKYSP